MAKKIYNKNAREKALLEEAYAQVYEGEEGALRLHGQYHPTMEKGIKDHIMQMVQYVKENNIDINDLQQIQKVVGEVASSMHSWFMTEYGVSNLQKDLQSALDGEVA